MLRKLSLLFSSWLLFGCVSQSVQLPPKTLHLGEVDHLLTIQQVESDQLGPQTKIKNLASKMREEGITSEQISTGRVVIVREGIYWFNVASGIKHDILHPVLVPDGIKVQIGNVVETEQGGSGDPNVIYRVRAENLKAGGCYFQDLPTGLVQGLMGALALIGPSGAATLYCQGIEKEGWQRPRTYWHKLP